MTRAARQIQTLAELLDAIDAGCAVVRRDGPTVIDRASIPSGRDGYPTRASGAQPAVVHVIRHETEVLDGGPGLHRAKCQGCDYLSPWWTTLAAASESARQHEDEHDQALDYSDPTGEAAAATGEPDPLLALARRTLRDLTKVDRTIAALANALTAETGKGANLAEPTDWCSHHLRHGMHEPRRIVNGRAAGDLCRQCRKFQDAQGSLPPRAIIEKWARGERVTERDLERVMSRRAG